MRSKTHPLALLVVLSGCVATCVAQELVTNRVQAMKLVQGLHYQHGEINLRNNLAKLNVPEEFKFLGPADAEAVLVKLWHNPPSPDNLGILLPADKEPIDEDCWAVTVAYVEDGYVKDDDAAKIKYDDLLKRMQKETRAASKERVKKGYPSVELVGWAEPPHYDAATHKLYWAKEIKFGDDPETTLNYNVRILGRRGVLVLNAISEMRQLPQIRQRTPQILGMVDFNPGHRYVDFDPKADKVATYGLAALVAGGVAAKLGLFKMLWVFILGAKKLVIIAFAAVAAGLRKLFGRKKVTPST